MTACVVIPARLASTRFPEKVLAADTGRPLVQHVVERVRGCRRVTEVIVAADHPKIAEALAPFGTKVVLTDPNHPSGTDRIAEVARTRGESLVVNVQGDEPEIEPEIVDALIERMSTTGLRMGTVAVPFADGMDPADTNLVKVILDLHGCAIYFSRASIPHHRDRPEPIAPAGSLVGAGLAGAGYDYARPLLHLGLYAYRRDFLLEFASLAPTVLERIEKLEQLRAVEHGVKIGVVLAKRATHGIDTLQQYQSFVQRWNDSSRQAGS